MIPFLRSFAGSSAILRKNEDSPHISQQKNSFRKEKKLALIVGHHQFCGKKRIFEPLCVKKNELDFQLVKNPLF